MPVPPKADPVKICQACGVQLTRKRFKSGRLEDRTVFLERRHCSQRCANTREIITRSGHQYRAKPYRKAACEKCGATAKLHVHHKDRNWRNDNQENLQTLCASCHLKLHWAEDREERIVAIRRSSGVRMGQLLDAGNQSLAEKRRLLPNPAHAENRGLARRSVNS